MKNRIFKLLAVFTLTLAGALLLGFTSAAAPIDGQVVPGQFIVMTRPGVDPAVVVAEHGLAARHVYRSALSGFAGAVPGRALAGLLADPRVLVVEQERIYFLDVQQLPTGIDRIEADKNPNANGVTVNLDVAIIDTGIDSDHPDLNVAGGRNFAGRNPNSWNDGNGHGTHVAGTVGALDNGSGVVGVAPGVRLWAVKVCRNGGLCFTGDMVAGIDWVAARKADGSIDFASANMSISTSDDSNPCTGSSNAVHRAICGLVSEGVVFAMAAGNDGRLKSAYPEAMAVAAIADFDGRGGSAGSPTCRSDEDDSLANFSNFGPSVDIAAPGVCVLSTWNDGGLNTISGTSMASPHVAGAVALYLHANNLQPATDSAGVEAIEAAIRGAALPQSHPCSYTNERGSNEPLLFVNGAAFGGDGSCDVAGGGGNNAPTAEDVSDSTPEDTSDTWSPSVSDPDGDPVSCTADSASVEGGVVSVASNCATGTYDPAPNFNGTDTFSYTACDSGGLCDSGTVTYSVSPVNDPPAAADDAASTTVNVPVTIDVLANDADVDGDTLTVTGASDPPSGSTVINADNTITYTPDADFVGEDSFSYEISDGNGGTDTANVSVTVSAPAVTMHVGDLDGSSLNNGSSWTAVVTIAVHDANENLVDGAVVSGSWSSGASGNGVCTTGASGSGACQISVSGMPKSTKSVTFTVGNVTHASLTYNAAKNQDPDGDSNGTTIEIAR